MANYSMDVLNERDKTYGNYQTNASIAQTLKMTLRSAPNWERLSADKRESLEMLCTKLGRILNGDPEYRDSWVDCCGYIQLIVDSLKK